jgi:hypothetical protein
MEASHAYRDPGARFSTVVAVTDYPSPVYHSVTVNFTLTAAGSGGFYTNLVPAAVITRAGDRLFVGAAAATTGATGQTEPTWLATSPFCTYGTYGSGWLLSPNATVAVVDQESMNGLMVATRTTDSRAANTQVAEAGTFLAWNEAVGSGYGPAWALYADARRAASAGVTLGIECDVSNYGANVPLTPFNPSPPGVTANLWMAAGWGSGALGLNPVSIGLNFLQNGTTFDTGINFAYNALTGTGGLSGLGTAISMATYQQISWQSYNAGVGGAGGAIYSTVSTSANALTVTFTDNGIAISGASGSTSPSVLMPPVAACTSAVYLFGGTASISPTISTYKSGGGAVDLAITPQGGGSIVCAAVIKPNSDNTLTCGASGARWSAVWAATGTIQTSDPSLKADIKPLPSALPLVAAIEPIRFRWIDGGASKPGKRQHWGWDAVQVRDVFGAIGEDFGGHVTEGGKHYLRPDQLVPVLWKAVQELAAEVAELKTGRA